MTETDDRQLKWAERVEHMLRLAENAGTAEEAQAFTDRAYAAMRDHMISAELIAQVRGEQSPDYVTEEKIEYTGSWQVALMAVGQVIAEVNDLKVLQQSVKWEKPTHTDLFLIGFKSDIDTVHTLNASVQIQLQRALQSWWFEQDRSWMGKMNQFKARREFILGFAAGLRRKLDAAKRAGERAAREAEAARTGDETGAARSVELVLVSRQERVKAWYDETYGDKVKTITRHYQSGGRAARNAGYAAGQQADTGQPSVGGSRKSIGR